METWRVEFCSLPESAGVDAPRSQSSLSGRRAVSKAFSCAPRAGTHVHLADRLCFDLFQTFRF